MPKSRSRKPGRARHGGGQPGNPRHRAALAQAAFLTDPAEQARARLALLVDFGDPSDPFQVIRACPLLMDISVAEAAGAMVEERCVDDCLILACSYAHLGIAAQVRAADYTIADTRDRSSTAHGTLTPRWEDGLLHGHTIVWIPAQRCLIDPTILQFLPEDSLSWEAVIARAAPGGQPAETVTVSHGRFRIAYTLAPPEATAAILSYPRMLEERGDILRRGMNIASAVLTLMAEHLPADRARQIPYPRAAALLTAIRGLPVEQAPAGDWRFTATGTGGKPARLTLAEIPLPAGTPPAAPMP